MVKERETINTNIRLNLANPDDREAWEHLQRMDRKKYKSYSRAVVIAVNDYFGRAERAEDDPYLETREKEDTFLQSVLDTVEKEALIQNLQKSCFNAIKKCPRIVTTGTLRSFIRERITWQI